MRGKRLFTGRSRTIASLATVVMLLVGTLLGLTTHASAQDNTTFNALSGRKYASNLGDSANPDGDPYMAMWDGWLLWQPALPSEGNREPFAIYVEIPSGKTFYFNGVACQLFGDVTHNGNESDNPIAAARGNQMTFSLVTDDNTAAWGFISCDGTFNPGFSIQLAPDGVQPSIVIDKTTTSSTGPAVPQAGKSKSKATKTPTTKKTATAGTPTPNEVATGTCTDGTKTWTLSYDPGKGVLYMDNFLTEIRQSNATNTVDCTLVTTVPGVVQIHGQNISVGPGTYQYHWDMNAGTDLGFSWTKTTTS